MTADDACCSVLLSSEAAQVVANNFEGSSMLLGGVENKEAKERMRSSENLRVPAAITDTGCERHLNEDRYAVIESPSGLAWLVCDGMGGESGGELAAQLAIDAIRRDLENLPERPADQALRGALLEANRVIVLRRQNQAFAQMGTTVVAALFSSYEVVIGHAGDSRAYLIRDGAIQQLTTDHTFVQRLVESGQIKPEEALSHPQAHVLTRAIGSEPGLEVSMQKFWLWPATEPEPPDCLMLCTDGLYSMVSESEICNAISQNSPQHACVKLVELAKQRGGFDNITLAVIPLPGQLRHEAPPEYEARRQKALKRAAERAAPVTGKARIVRDGIILSLVVVLLVVLAFVGWLATQGG